MTILFVSGVNDPSTVAIDLDENGKITFLMNGNCSVAPKLRLREGVAANFLIFGKGVRQSSIDFKVPPSLIFNQIAEPDTHRGALERCIELCDQVNTTVINHPRHVLQTSRDKVAEMLQGIPGVRVPRTQRFRPRSPQEVFSRAKAEGFDFPFIVRVIGLHDGRGMVKVDSAGDESWLHALPFDGREFYLTQFVDYRDEGGLYHKQRIVVIDGEPMLRHSLYDKNWNIHGASRDFMRTRDSWEEDIAYFDRVNKELLPPVRPAIDEITRRLQLEYYGIDCNLKPDGTMLLFEANASMNVLHNPNPEVSYRVEAIEQRLYATLTKYSGERVI